MAVHNLGKRIYLVLGWAYYLMTILCASTAIVVLVQGFFSQADGELFFAFVYYIATIFLLVVSFFFFKGGHSKVSIAESSP